MTERLIPESQLETLVQTKVKQTLRQILAGALDLSDPSTDPDDIWMETTQAASLLGKTPKQLRARIRSGIFEQDLHWRYNNSDLNHRSPRYQLHIGRCKQRLYKDDRTQIKGRKQ